MSEAHARAWWEDVEHLREAAERRIAERERAQREGRFRARTERSGTMGAGSPPVVAGSQPHAVVARPVSSPATSSPATASAAAAATATATALALDLAPAEPDLDRTLETDRRRRTGRFDRTEPDRPSRREELSRLAREQAQAAAAPRPRGERGESGAAREPRRMAATTSRSARSGAATTTRRTIEIRGQVAHRPAIAAVPDPIDAPLGRRRTRPGPTVAERFAARPDRVAQWAFLLGLFLIVVAAISAH